MGFALKFRLGLKPAGSVFLVWHGFMLFYALKLNDEVSGLGFATAME